MRSGALLSIGYRRALLLTGPGLRRGWFAVGGYRQGPECFVRAANALYTLDTPRGLVCGLCVPVCRPRPVPSTPPCVGHATMLSHSRGLMSFFDTPRPLCSPPLRQGAGLGSNDTPVRVALLSSCSLYPRRQPNPGPYVWFDRGGLLRCIFDRPCSCAVCVVCGV